MLFLQVCIQSLFFTQGWKHRDVAIGTKNLLDLSKVTRLLNDQDELSSISSAILLVLKCTGKFVPEVNSPLVLKAEGER